MEMQTNSCPCCGSPLLRHARVGGVYWFCTSCRQEVPLLAVSRMPPKPLKISQPIASVRQSRPIQTVNM